MHFDHLSLTEKILPSLGRRQKEIELDLKERVLFRRVLDRGKFERRHLDGLEIKLVRDLESPWSETFCVVTWTTWYL